MTDIDETFPTKTIYVVVGTTEHIAQDRIGGPFTSQYTQEVVKAFEAFKRAEEYIHQRRLAKPKKEAYAGKMYYKGGYYEMEVQSVELEGWRID